MLNIPPAEVHWFAVGPTVGQNPLKTGKLRLMVAPFRPSDASAL